MPILRYGPWAQTNFDITSVTPLNEITDFSNEPPALSGPVNIANIDWPDQNWGVLFKKLRYDVESNIYFYDSGGVAELGDTISFTASEGGGDQIQIFLYYQAVTQFDLQFDWEFKIDPPLPGFSPENFSIGSYRTIEDGVEIDAFDEFGISGSEQITLPASTLGRVFIDVIFSFGAIPEESVEVSFSVPEPE